MTAVTMNFLESSHRCVCSLFAGNLGLAHEIKLGITKVLGYKANLENMQENQASEHYTL